MNKRMRRGRKAIAAWCRAPLHAPLDYQQRMLNAKLRGHDQYYGRPTNFRSLNRFQAGVRQIWRTGLSAAREDAAFPGSASTYSCSALRYGLRALPMLGRLGESYLRNPLRELRTGGSMRRERGNPLAYSDTSPWRPC